VTTVTERTSNVGGIEPTLRLTLPAKAENIAVIRQALGGLAAELGVGPEMVDDIKTAVSEAATNVVVHAYPDGEEGPIEVLATARGREFEVIVRDRGIGMQPRPLGLEAQSLRVGLALIGALTAGVEIRGEQGEGTQVRMSFPLEPDAIGVPGFDSEPAVVEEDQTLIAVHGAESGGAAIPKILEILAARSDLDLDRLSDVQLIGDYLSHWTSHATVDSRPLSIVINEQTTALEIAIGPLEPGLGDRMLKQSELPGFGNTLERMVDKAEVIGRETEHGQADFLVLEIASQDA
jgi:anti-sigma regulatory factor (Ser/Thr protein kinase)